MGEEKIRHKYFRRRLPGKKNTRKCFFRPPAVNSRPALKGPETKKRGDGRGKVELLNGGVR